MQFYNFILMMLRERKRFAKRMNHLLTIHANNSTMKSEMRLSNKFYKSSILNRCWDFHRIACWSRNSGTKDVSINVINVNIIHIECNVITGTTIYSNNKNASMRYMKFHWVCHQDIEKTDTDHLPSDHHMERYRSDGSHHGSRRLLDFHGEEITVRRWQR